MLLQFDTAGNPYIVFTDEDRAEEERRWKEHSSYPILQRLRRLLDLFWEENPELLDAAGMLRAPCAMYDAMTDLMEDIWLGRPLWHPGPSAASGHKCVACGKEHAGCCGQCPQWVPIGETERQARNAPR